jgi:hypothetical protein
MCKARAQGGLFLLPSSGLFKKVLLLPSSGLFLLPLLSQEAKEKVKSPSFALQRTCSPSFAFAFARGKSKGDKGCLGKSKGDKGCFCLLQSKGKRQGQKVT